MNSAQKLMTEKEPDTIHLRPSDRAPLHSSKWRSKGGLAVGITAVGSRMYRMEKLFDNCCFKRSVNVGNSGLKLQSPPQLHVV